MLNGSLLSFLFVFRFIASSSEPSTCNKAFPTQGTWLRDLPLWKQKDCPAQAFDINSTEACLAGRTLYVIGISTARQIAFSTMTALGGEAVDRVTQKTLCPLNGQVWGDSCHQSLKGVNIKFLYLNYMDGFNYTDRGGFPFILKESPLYSASKHYNNANEAKDEAKEVALYPADFCTERHTHACFAEFFEASKPEDLLVFNVGYSYAVPTSIIDNQAWIADAAKHFHENIRRTFRGKHVFQIAMGQMHNDWEYRSHTHYEANARLFDAWKDAFAHSPVTPKHPHSESPAQQEWFIIDQWAINEGRNFLYNDRIHFAGPLTDASLQQIMNSLCPGRGKPVAFPVALPTSPELVGKLVLVTKINEEGGGVTSERGVFKRLDGVNMPVGWTERSKYEYFTVNPAGYLQKHFNASSRCIDILQHTGVLEISKDVLQLLPLASSEIGDICKERSLFRPSSQKSVYAIKDGHKLAFKNRNDFVSQGFDFGDVVTIDDWLFDLIP